MDTPRRRPPAATQRGITPCQFVGLTRYHRQYVVFRYRQVSHYPKGVITRSTGTGDELIVHHGADQSLRELLGPSRPLPDPSSKFWSSH